MSKLNDKSILLIEPNLGGHHKTYLYYFTKTLLELNCNIEVYSKSNVSKLENVVYNRLYYKPPLNLPTNFIFKKIIIIINLFRTIYNIIQVRTKITKNQNVFFCCMDEYMHELMPKLLFEMLLPIKFSGLLLSSYKSNVSKYFDNRSILKSKYCCSIGILDEFTFEEVKKYQSNVIRFPDFSDDCLPNMDFYVTKQVLEKANGRKIISLLGHISKRKGYETLIQCSNILPNDKYFFLIAGKESLNKEEINFIKNNLSTKENFLYVKEYIPSEADFNSLVYISNVIFAAYINFPHSSNMLAKAALFNKPIIVSKGYYMDRIVTNYRMGLSIDSCSAKECADAIEQLINNINLNYNSQEYLKNNRISNLKESFISILHSYR